MKTISRLPLSRWLILFAVLAVAVAADGRYHIIKKIPVPGDYGWDYLTADSDARRLYVYHDREVVVLDLDTNAVIGKIPGDRCSRHRDCQRFWARFYQLQRSRFDRHLRFEDPCGYRASPRRSGPERHFVRPKNPTHFYG
jgi:hypothetical protein